MSGFAFALANRLAFFVDFPTATCDSSADRKTVACNAVELNDMCFRRADLPRTGRGDADVDILWRRVAATPRPCDVDIQWR